MTQGRIYLLRAKNTDLYKIGFTTKHPDERKAALQTGCPHELELVYFWDGSQDDERLLHASFEMFQTHGEWFRLTLADLIAYIMRDRRRRGIVQPKIPMVVQTFLYQLREEDRYLSLDGECIFVQGRLVNNSEELRSAVSGNAKLRTSFDACKAHGDPFEMLLDALA